MNFNKYLSHVVRKCKKIPRLRYSDNTSSSISYLSTQKTSGSLKNSQRLLVGVCQKYEVNPGQGPVCFSSSIANEEKVFQKNPESVISVPTLQFEDMTFDLPVSHRDLCDALQVCNSVEEQLMALSSTLALSSDDIENRFKFCKTFESLLEPFFGKLKIQIFGSSVNGFGFKGCDIDMSFETLTEPKEQISYLENPDIPLVSEVLCGKVTPEEISLLPRKEQLLFIHTVLLEFYKETAEPVIFISAHVPLIRFYHDKFNLKCDLTCKNKVAFANSKLLYLFGKLDERVIPLMMAIRYWAKHVDLIGKGLLFNTYTISLMVIHFLQTRSPPILPSAKQILQISDKLEIEDMNDKSFLEIAKSIPPSENTQTLTELLQGFFYFYLFFDFTRVISPLIGGSVPRDIFFSDSSKKFRMNTICVQDPMLVSHNVADLVDYKTCKKFFKELMIAHKLIQDKGNLVPSSSKWGILTLIDKSTDHHYQLTVQKYESFSVPLLKKSLIDKYDNESNRRLMTAQTLLYLLQHILLFECKILGVSDIMKLLKNHDEMVEKQRKILESTANLNFEIRELGRIKRGQAKKLDNNEKSTPVPLMLEEFQDVISKHSLVLAAKCKVVKNTWLGRDFVPTELFVTKTPDDIIEKEYHISVQASKQNNLNYIEGKMKPFTFFYECYESLQDPESSLIVNFRPFQKTNFNPILGIFLKEYVSKLITDLNELC